jgi:nucleotide-binding universal stress UspA family protein
VDGHLYVALKDLLVYVDQTPSAPQRLQLAIDLARRNHSSLTALFVNVLNLTQMEQRAAAELGLASAAQYATLNRSIAAEIATASESLHAILARAAVEYRLHTQWCSVNGFPEAVVPQQARYRDLCILGHHEVGESAPVNYSFSEHVLFIAGRPVLLVPTSGAFDTLGRHIAIAWNSSRPASRAVNDALPLIERCERATVICVDSDRYIGKHSALPPEHLIEHLGRHGIEAELVLISSVPSGSVAALLQSKARELGADMLVAGAFGHAKLREKLLGGVTCDLLAHTLLPLLMSY